MRSFIVGENIARARSIRSDLASVGINVPSSYLRSATTTRSLEVLSADVVFVESTLLDWMSPARVTLTYRERMGDIKAIVPVGGRC